LDKRRDHWRLGDYIFRAVWESCSSLLPCNNYPLDMSDSHWDRRSLWESKYHHHTFRPPPDLQRRNDPVCRDNRCNRRYRLDRIMLHRDISCNERWRTCPLDRCRYRKDMEWDRYFLVDSTYHGDKVRSYLIDRIYPVWNHRFR